MASKWTSGYLAGKSLDWTRQCAVVASAHLRHWKIISGHDNTTKSSTWWWCTLHISSISLFDDWWRDHPKRRLLQREGLRSIVGSQFDRANGTNLLYFLIFPRCCVRLNETSTMTTASGCWLLGPLTWTKAAAKSSKLQVDFEVFNEALRV